MFKIIQNYWHTEQEPIRPFCHLFQVVFSLPVIVHSWKFESVWHNIWNLRTTKYTYIEPTIYFIVNFNIFTSRQAQLQHGKDWRFVFKMDCCILNIIRWHFWIPQTSSSPPALKSYNAFPTCGFSFAPSSFCDLKLWVPAIGLSNDSKLCIGGVEYDGNSSLIWKEYKGMVCTLDLKNLSNLSGI